MAKEHILTPVSVLLRLEIVLAFLGPISQPFSLLVAFIFVTLNTFTDIRYRKLLTGTKRYLFLGMMSLINALSYTVVLIIEHPPIYEDSSLGLIVNRNRIEGELRMTIINIGIILFFRTIVFLLEEIYKLRKMRSIEISK